MSRQLFGELDIKEIVLRVAQNEICHLIDEWPFAERPEFGTRYIIETMQHMLHAMVRFAEQPCKPVKYPADWRQAVKERFAPAWVLRRWPVVYVIWEPSVVYPEIALPDHRRYITIRKVDFLPSWQA